MHISKSNKGYRTGPLNSYPAYNQYLITRGIFEAFVNLAISAKNRHCTGETEQLTGNEQLTDCTDFSKDTGRAEGST